MSESEASSIEPENPPVIFYRAEVRYRGRKTVMHLLVYLGLAVGAGSWCAETPADPTRAAASRIDRPGTPVYD